MLAEPIGCYLLWIVQQFESLPLDASCLFLVLMVCAFEFGAEKSACLGHEGSAVLNSGEARHLTNMSHTFLRLLL